MENIKESIKCRLRTMVDAVAHFENQIDHINRELDLEKKWINYGEPRQIMVMLEEALGLLDNILIPVPTDDGGEIEQKLIMLLKTRTVRWWERHKAKEAKKEKESEKK